LPGNLDAKLVIACHDELVVEHPEDQAEEEVMVIGMDEVVNADLVLSAPTGLP
jgi:DNA polymerase I-like protein with 3'-5' exonuclease and polymerase domains